MNLRRLSAAAVTVLVLAAGSAHARGQLQTRQTGVELPAGARAGRLVLANTGDAPVAAQIRVYAWSQNGQDDHLEPSQGLIASPPIVEIPAGGEQLVRLVRPVAAAVDAEMAFRVVVDELPGDAAEDGVTVRMRFLIPAFVRASDPAPTTLQCQLDGAALACQNSGGRAAQLGASRLVDAGGRAVELSKGLLGYVLAGSTRRFSLDASRLAALGADARLEVSLNGQPATIALGRGR